MKKLTSVIFFIVFHHLSFSQDTTGSRRSYHLHKGVDTLTKQLMLSPEQARSLLSIENTTLEALSALPVSSQKEVAKSTTATRSMLVAQRASRIRALLTQEQYNKYLLIREARIREIEEKKQYEMHKTKPVQ